MGDPEIDEEEGGVPAADAGAGSSPLIKWLIYIAGAVFGIIIVVLVSMFVAKQAATSTFREMKNVSLVKPPPPLVTFAFQEEFRINTADKGETHFVKMKLSFGVAKDDTKITNELAERIAQMRDLVNLIVGRKTKDDLIDVEDQLDLREEIKAQINHILSEGKIQEVYFTEFIVN
ncbi:flagellar basal body-associated FliL family protein [Leptospira fluminis]|uniref:Flagellar protein FliL n=2 Tax=Leptospira TaxID=171 RepID=A0A4R9GT54_9LEPT|nr:MULTISPECIES: flagellar basal body-associated FliL family protein [Leptospira]TGK12096.1 flagellar basal body-associated FliL family protein [Leptospira fletcheri]TGK20770.1 flagellar basal body-associated FliL family protein [Leptospira fluminis]